ncbi:SusE domain-containing protein [Pseudoflavitalea rhizosphaerae]|uniref:SusE domain-containing protein n=1 Tax=Pseudoflavitalea rhizosphaerae TaxID=1884793 RepID=UPI000F8EE307|nr:SusE domain-containing protein [Pseudoflavitalea rhizosphaerae]
MRSIQIACRLIVFSLLLAACQKVDYDKTITGEGIETGTFRIQSPATASNIALNAATPSAPLVIRWTAAKPGVDKPITYKWVAVKKGEDISKYTFELPADNDGKATTLTITQEKMDLYLFSKGIPNKGSVELIWSIQASNGETQVLSQDQFQLTLNRFTDGATPFTLYGPEPIINTATVDPTSTADFYQFKWQKSVAAAGSPAVKYRVVFALEDGDFSDPVFSIASDNNGSDSALKMTYKQLSDSLDKNDQDDLSKENRLKWAVQAISGDWVQWSDVNNAMNILRQVRFYVVGKIDGWSEWNIDDPLQIIPDKAAGRYAKVFYAYLKLKAGNEFKFFKTKGDWGSGYGPISGSNGEYETGFNQGSGNFSVAADGVYRVTIDLSKNKVYIQNNQPGVIGEVQQPTWDVNNILRGYPVAHNKFMFLVNSDGAKQFKFNDGNNWDDAEPNQTRIFGMDEEKPGMLVSPGGNITASGSPVSRLVWDGTDPQALKYTTEAAHMYLIGDATEGGWDNANANLPELTYQGNGIWKGTNIPLTGTKQFKFLLKKGTWDFNYGSTANEPGPLTGDIKEGGANIGVATTGNYTVEIDEYKRTYKVY